MDSTASLHEVITHSILSPCLVMLVHELLSPKLQPLMLLLNPRLVMDHSPQLADSGAVADIKLMICVLGRFHEDL